MDRPKTPGPSRAKTPGIDRERPNTPHSIASSRFITAGPEGTSILLTPPDRARTRTAEKYSFTRVFSEASPQLEVFRSTVLPLVHDAIRGKDGMMATLGVTGSGKTHTILGNSEQRGMIQLSLDVVFSALRGKMVDYERLDMPSFDNSDAVVIDAPTFFARVAAAMEVMHAAGTSKRVSIAATTPVEPMLEGEEEVLVDGDPKSGYAVLISMYELYNERIFDLLDESPLVNPAARRKALLFKKPSTQSPWETSREQKKVVAGLRKVCVSNYDEALQVVEHAQTCRKVSATNLNMSSSRSHAFLQIEIKRFSSRGVEKDSSSLHIVDLAGSERARNAQTAGSQLVEAGSINKSLMMLGQCLASQQPGSASQPPYRSSKLTEVLFSNTFTGISKQKAVILVTADPMGDYNPTLQVLKYSALAKEAIVSHPPPPRSIRTVSGSTELLSDTEGPGGSGVGGGVGGGGPNTLSKDALIRRLVAQLEETESRWRDAEDRCLMIEQSVREEMADEMEARLEDARRAAMEARVQDAEWRDEFVDEKLDILRRGMEDELSVYEDEDATGDTGRSKLDQLQRENEALRRELDALKRERANRSPTKPTTYMPNVGIKMGMHRSAVLGGIENTV
ncbi:P-loop containing nucleoside triphosphate hydrolase protein [Tricharina praecox]|uniref:P-loop containing nucleoside triphosphate hydrolase protein n=1 Tax=Tricharina praecox TaxID=43433 RepID=UPI002220F047|nr:P-loop containing nucleoside triphosphate hydrolase protein [Tricharina praecox]KAI5845402.1 P-loop containing nucleoside triphosphate hydrolase protein [Tricharina praecox]